MTDREVSAGWIAALAPVGLLPVIAVHIGADVALYYGRACSAVGS